MVSDWARIQPEDQYRCLWAKSQIGQSQTGKVLKSMDVLWLYDERYFNYKKAYDKLPNPPAELLLLLSGCNSAPGVPPTTDEESEAYLRKAIEKKSVMKGLLK
jgi:hypothetical protein